MVDKDKVISLLASGVSPTQVASAVGCEISYISQLLGDEVIAQKIAEARTAEVMKYKSMDDKYDELENKLLKKLEDLIPYFMKPDQVIRGLTFLNQAKRKSSGIIGEVNAGQVVKLQLPSVTINNYKINMNGNMVEVAGRNLQAMSSDLLMKSLENKDGAANDPQKIPQLLAQDIRPKLPETSIVSEKSV